MDYKIKFYKYKKKYQELLQLNGGSAAEQDPEFLRAIEESKKTFQEQQPQMVEAFRRSKIESERSGYSESRLIREIQRDYKNPNVFIIFTTGLADSRLRNFWLRYNLHLHLLSLIPPSFNKIKFIHFDPDIKFSDSQEPGINDSDILKINMQASDSERIFESSFYKHFFPFKSINFSDLNHLVLDFAHLFKYEPHRFGIVKTSGHYQEQDKGGMPIIGMKSVYIFYDNIFTIYLSNFFKFNDRRQLITYIERMLELGFKLNNPSYPIDNINSIINLFIRKELYHKYKMNMPMYDFDRLFTNNNELINNLTISFINEYLWLTSPMNIILKEFKNYIEQEFKRISRENGFQIT